MKRKIIRLGTATNVISLPSKWTRRFDLKAGDEVEVIEDGSTVKITVDKSVSGRSAILDISSLGSLVNYSLLALYISGIDEVKVISNNPKQLEKLQNHPLPELIGWEIVEQSKDYCIIKDVSGETNTDIDTILGRILMLIQNMAEEIEKTVRSASTELSHIDSIDKSANRFVNLYSRKLHKIGHSEARKTAVMFYILTSLESIGDHYSDLAKYISVNKLLLGKQTISHLEKCNSLLLAYRKILLNYKTEDAVSLDEIYRQLRKKIDQDIQNIKNIKEARCSAFILAIADLLASMMRNQLIISIQERNI